MADPAHTAYQEEATIDITPGEWTPGIIFKHVPAGKRLVIEHVAVRAELPLGQTARASIVVSVQDQPIEHWLVMVGQGIVMGTPTHRAVFVASQPLRLYEDPGGGWGVNMERDSDVGGGVAYASISGYFVDLP